VQAAEIDVQGTSPTKVTESMIYGPPSAEYLNLLRASNHTSWRDQSGENVRTFEASVVARKCELPPDAFTLSAFGLPAPILRTERVRYWLWINVTAVFLLFLALWLRRRQGAGS